MKEKILSLVEQAKYVEARKEIISLNVVDTARLFEEINQQKLLILFRILPKDLSSDVFTHMPSELQQYVIESITDEEAISILDNIFIPVQHNNALSEEYSIFIKKKIKGVYGE